MTKKLGSLTSDGKDRLSTLKKYSSLDKQEKLECYTDNEEIFTNGILEPEQSNFRKYIIYQFVDMQTSDITDENDKSRFRSEVSAMNLNDYIV